MKYLFLLFLSLSILSCKKNTNESTVSSVNKSDSLSDSNATSKDLSKEELLKKINEEVIQTIKNQDLAGFSNYIHPEKGITFSMYAFVNDKENKHFSKDDFIKFYPTNTLFTWGLKDGTGDVYKATIQQYFKDWVFKKDFTKSQTAVNDFLGSGNSLNNLKEIFPKADFTENFVKGTELSEMDWGALRLVFENVEGKYYIIAVINDEWTI